jgi:hypothetical protein
MVVLEIILNAQRAAAALHRNVTQQDNHDDFIVDDPSSKSPHGVDLIEFLP